jgi:hypothetical protein
MEKKKTETSTSEIVGYILISPAVVSTFLFFADLFMDEPLGLLYNLNSLWSGWEGSSNLPIYFGLMAIAGAYLLKNEKTKASDHAYDENEFEAE